MIKTKRDNLLLENLSDYGMLSTKQIAAIFFAGVDIRTVLRRLRILEKHKLIKRAGKLEENNEALWLATEKAGMELGRKDLKLYCQKSNLNHDYELTRLRIFLERTGIASNWVSEHQLKSHIFSKYGRSEAKNKQIPDGVFDSEVKDYKVACAVELELSLKDKARYRKIINNYLYKEHLHLVWYFVQSKSLFNTLKSYWYKERSSFSKVKVFFTYLQDLQINGVEAKMIGLESTYLIKNYFSNLKQSAHLPAHSVSMSKEFNELSKSQATSQIHTGSFNQSFA